MFTKRSAIKIVGNFAHDVKNSGVKLKKVILYGSYAQNKQRETSDIDVALVADDFSGFGYEDIKQFVLVLIRSPYYIIQPKTYSTKYFKKGDPFVDEIKRTGIEIKI